MARRKNAPEAIRLKQSLSERLRELRTEFFGDRGGPDMARTLGILVRTWYNYESGVTVPAEIILQVVELTSVEPVWLLRGEGPKFRPAAVPPAPSAAGLEASSVASLLRAALDQLEQREKQDKAEMEPACAVATPVVAHLDDWEPVRGKSNLIYVGDGRPTTGQAITPDDPHYYAARRDWLNARRDLHHLQVADESMAPIVAEGAHVTYAEAEGASIALHDKLVVAWVEGKPVIRWFQHCGRFALLRAENIAVVPTSTLVELDGADVDQQFHRVLWISTPH